MEDEKKIKQRSGGSEPVHYLRERVESDKQLQVNYVQSQAQQSQIFMALIEKLSK